MAHDGDLYKIHRSQERAYLSEIEDVLEGVEFPADKADLINIAREHGADERVILALRDIPEQEYLNERHVEQFLVDQEEE